MVDPASQQETDGTEELLDQHVDLDSEQDPTDITNNYFFVFPDSLAECVQIV